MKNIVLNYLPLIRHSSYFTVDPSPFYSECWKSSARFEHGFLDMLDSRVARPGTKVVFEFFNGVLRPFDKRFDAAVSQIANITSHLVRSRRALGKEPEAYALHLAADDEFPSNDHGYKFQVSRFRFQVGKTNMRPNPETEPRNVKHET